MPELITALLRYRTSGSCVALPEALETVSHDRLPGLLQGDWSGHTLLESAFRTIFVWQCGDLIIDNPVIPKPLAAAIEGLAWVFSSQEQKPVYGVFSVLLVWTDGTLRLPLGIRLQTSPGAWPPPPPNACGSRQLFSTSTARASTSMAAITGPRRPTPTCCT